MPNLTLEQAHSMVEAALIASDTSAANAQSVASALIGAELSGQGGHGLRRVASYAAQAKTGKVQGHAVPVAELARPAALRVNAGYGFAYPAIDMAIAKLTEMASAQGIAVAGVYNSHHAGVAGLSVARLADAGLIGLMFANSPGAIAPWGGNKALYGTNPIAFAAPRDGGEPILVDVSLSTVARGKVMAANQKGESIPEGWAFGPDGKPTTDPKQGLAGTMAPLGDAKGTALALMVELLAAGLTGSNFAYEASSLFDDKGDPPALGQLIIAIDPAAFGGASVTARFAELASEITGQEGTRIPGARRTQIAQKITENGIEVDDALMAEITSIAAG